MQHIFGLEKIKYKFWFYNQILVLSSHFLTGKKLFLINYIKAQINMTLMPFTTVCKIFIRLSDYQINLFRVQSMDIAITIQHLS